MQSTLFISDLHLCESRPQITHAFLTWVKQLPKEIESIYILGDLFEYWAGDDATNSTFHLPILHAFKALTQSGKAIFLMHGNRDFLIGQAFSQATGVQLLKDPTLVKLYELNVLLSHGDALCTDDVTYMTFRKEVREPVWQRQFLSQPVQARNAYIQQARLASEAAKSTKSMTIMDVNALEVEKLLRQHGVPTLFIHGHTHRPRQHAHLIDGKTVHRWVLGDWYEQGSYLKLNADGTIVSELVKLESAL